MWSTKSQNLGFFCGRKTTRSGTWRKFIFYGRTCLFYRPAQGNDLVDCNRIENNARTDRRSDIYFTSRPSTKLFSTHRQIEWISSTVCHNKEWPICQGIYKYLVLGRNKSYFVNKNHSDSTKKIPWNWCHQNAWVWLTTYLLCLVGAFLTDSRHTYGYKPCSSRRIALLFVRNSLHTVAGAVVVVIVW